MGCCSIEICREIERNRVSFRDNELVSRNRLHFSSNRICGQVLFINFLSLILTWYYFTLIEMISINFESWKYICFHYFLPFEPLSTSNPTHNPNHTPVTLGNFRTLILINNNNNDNFFSLTLQKEWTPDLIRSIVRLPVGGWRLIRA